MPERGGFGRARTPSDHQICASCRAHARGAARRRVGAMRARRTTTTDGRAAREAVGYSCVQSSIIVSGLWGIFYYREAAPRDAAAWFVCAAVCVSGMVLLGLITT